MTQTYTPPAPATSGGHTSLRRVLFVVWAVLTLIAVGFVVMFGTNAPYADEWEFVPALLGEEPALPWLWQQHNEHRLPLPRAVYLALFKLTQDFRAGMLLQVAMLSALALYLMRLAASLRGKPHWADMFFPISLLHIGHWENFVMGYQLCFALFAVLATGLAVVALRITRENAFRSGVAAGVLLMLLALTGGSGLPVVPPVAVWLAVVALSEWRRGEKARGLLILLLALLPVAYLGLYFVNYQKPPLHPAPSFDPLAVGRVAGEVLAMALGIGVCEAWWAVLAGVLAMGVLTLALILPRWKEPDARLSVIGLVAVAAGVTGVAVAIGIGRGGWNSGLWSRYALLVWPLLATTYLVWVKLARKWVPIALCLAAALAFPANTAFGLGSGMQVKLEYQAIESEASAGRSAEQIVSAEEERSRRHPEATALVLQRERAIRGIPMLRKAQIGIFAGK